jgi:hypothetical protein
VPKQYYLVHALATHTPVKREGTNLEPYNGFHLAILVFDEEAAVQDVAQYTVFGCRGCPRASMNVVDKSFFWTCALRVLNRTLRKPKC